MKSNTETIIKAMRILSAEIHSDDGVANAATAEAADRLDELQQLNAELTAQVELLRLRLDDILEDMQLSLELSENDCDIWKGRIKDTLALTPAQCLAEVKAQAGRDGFIAGTKHADKPIRGMWSVNDLTAHAEEYANQIRQSANAGEQ